MYQFGTTNWLYKPFKLMDRGENFRYYTLTNSNDNIRIHNFVIFRTSEKCFRVVYWLRNLLGLHTDLKYKTFRTWTEVYCFAHSYVSNRVVK